MGRLFICMAVVLSLTEITAQTIKIRVNNLNLNQGKSQLSYLEGEKAVPVMADTIYSKDEMDFNYKFLGHSGHVGFYRLSFTNNKWIDFINDNEDVTLSTDANNISDSMRVIKSESNKLYYNFIKLNKLYKIKTDLLLLLLAKYPKDDDYYSSTKNKLVQLQKEYIHFVNITSQANKKSFIARYIKSVQLSTADINVPFEKQLAYLKTHCLDNVDFNNDDLIYSDAFTSKSIEYLTLFRNPQLPKELLEKEFMSAVDTILNKAKVNQLVYKHVTEYLIDGFKQFGFDEVIDYIVDSYVIKDDICLDEKLQNSIQRRMDQSKRFKIGALVPQIIIPDANNKEVDLYDINKDKTLIIFYASWCPHCQELLPKINNLYSNHKDAKLKILAISIDTNKTDWLNFVEKNDFKWINVSDLKGWYGKAAQDYYLYATPTMFIVDNKNKVIAKPTNINDISKYME
jgi:peroxiredoxin